MEGTLHLRVTSSGACLLQYAQDLVLERVNIFFGYKALSKLQMTHDLVHLKPSKDVQQTFSLSQEEGEWLKSLIEDIQDQELKTHLENLGKGICHLKKT